MCTLHGLGSRAHTTFEALEECLRQRESVTPMQLAKCLYPEETRLLENIEAFTQSVPESIQKLPPDDVERLRHLAKPLEDGRRRSRALRILARKIVCAELEALQIERGHAQRLADLLGSALTQDVQNRVHELRIQLEALGPDEDEHHRTVSRAPYRFARVPRPLTETDEDALHALYPMLDRRAWKKPPSCLETRAVRVALQRLRFAISTGTMLADNRTPLQRQGVAKCRLSDLVRNDLDWVIEVSNQKQEIFEMFYVPRRTSWERVRFYVLAQWAEPHAVDIVTFILASRNEILRVLNDLFQSLGERPYPLVTGHDFPEHLVPLGRIPAQPILLSRERLTAMHRKLRAIGIEHLFPDSHGTAVAGSD